MLSSERDGHSTLTREAQPDRVIRLTDGDLRGGDGIRIAGRMTELVQAVESLHIEQAARGAEVAVKVRAPARRHDQVYCVRMGEQTVEEPRARRHVVLKVSDLQRSDVT